MKAIELGRPGQAQEAMQDHLSDHERVVRAYIEWHEARGGRGRPRAHETSK